MSKSGQFPMFNAPQQIQMQPEQPQQHPIYYNSHESVHPPALSFGAQSNLMPTLTSKHLPDASVEISDNTLQAQSIPSEMHGGNEPLVLPNQHTSQHSGADLGSNAIFEEPGFPDLDIFDVEDLFNWNDGSALAMDFVPDTQVDFPQQDN